MTNLLIPPETPCVIADFDPGDDMLVIALPEDKDGGLDHSIRFRRDRPGGFLEVALTHKASNARFIVQLPGLARLDPSAIAVVSLDGSETRLPPPPEELAVPPSGKTFCPREKLPKSNGPRKLAFVHRHNWHRDGPPDERFFDLSNPASELDVRLDPVGGGPIYAIRLTETASKPGQETVDKHRSIILAQTSPNTPPLSNGILKQWIASRLGSSDFRIIARIWLGNEGHYTDPATGERRHFGAINDNPLLAIRGPLAGSIAVER